MQKFIWSQLLFGNRPRCILKDHVLSNSAAASGWERTQGNKLQWLGHSAFRWQIGNTVLLSDPLLTNRASPFQFFGPKRFVPSPLKPEQAQAEIILITHNHYDHLDAQTIKRLPNLPQVKFIVPTNLAPTMQAMGAQNVAELGWHQSIQVGDLKITFVPAVHFSSRWLDDRNKTLWGGYIVEGAGLKIYLSGDTTTHPSLFKDIGERYGALDYALIPIGAYEPRAIMRASHTTPEEAVQIGVDVKAQKLIAHHWGALALTPEPAFEPPQRFRAAATAAGFDDNHALILKVGETQRL